MGKQVKRVLLLTLTVSLLSGCMGKTAGSYYKDGNKNMEKGEYEDALVHFTQAIEKNPERAEYYIGSGFALIGVEKFEEALNQFDKGFSSKDNQVVRENNKAIFRGKGIALLRLGKYEKAKSEFLKALELKESAELNDDITQYLALTETKLGNYAEAIRLYESMIKKEKPNAEGYFRLARAYRNVGEYEKALKCFEELIALDAVNFDAFFGEYEIYTETEQTEKAKEALERAAGIKVTDDIGTFHHGVLEFLRGNYDKATIDLEVAYDKKIPESSYYLGRIAEIKKDYKAARTFYERFQKETGIVTMSGWYDGMALCEMKEENYEKALEYVKKGITLEDVSFSKSLFLKKIAIEEKLNHYVAAFETTQEYLKLFPNDEKVQKEAAFLKSRFKKEKKKKK